MCSSDLSITGVKDAISGYQRGQCFYCSKELNFSETHTPDAIRVDHLLPFSLMTKTNLSEDLDRVDLNHGSLSENQH